MLEYGVERTYFSEERPKSLPRLQSNRSVPSDTSFSDRLEREATATALEVIMLTFPIGFKRTVTVKLKRRWSPLRMNVLTPVLHRALCITLTKRKLLLPFVNCQ